MLYMVYIYILFTIYLCIYIHKNYIFIANKYTFDVLSFYIVVLMPNQVVFHSFFKYSCLALTRSSLLFDILFRKLLVSFLLKKRKTNDTKIILKQFAVIRLFKL